MANDYVEQKNVPVKVVDGKMYMSIDVKTTGMGFEDMIKGIKHMFNGKWVVDEFKVTDPNKYTDGIPRITTTMRIDNLNNPIYTSIYVTAMGSWPVFRIMPQLDTLKEVAADPVKAFVARLYTEVLGREADEKGLNDWTEVLKAQKETGAKVAMGFVDSDEFKAKDMTDEAFLQIMYRTFLVRDADEAGLKDWGAELEKGMSRMFVFRGFVESDEFTKICEEYNIIRGNVELNAPMDQVANQETTKFVARCYKVFLGRKADAEGINAWVSQLAAGKNNAKQAAYGFVMSDEFQGKNLSNKEYVKTIYIGLLDREADPVGLAEWVKVLEDGGSRLDIFYGFADSPEFRDLARSYNLNGDWKAN